MKFSVIVPFLNEAEYLETCIHSLKQQTLNKSEYELIFIDNGSTDGSAEIIKKYPDIIYLSEPIKDAYIARNRGIQVAKGDIIVFTDADCAVSANWLATYDSAFEDESIDMAIGYINFPGQTSSPLLRYYEAYYASKMRLMTTALPRETCYGHAGNMAVRSRVFSELGLFSPMPIVGDAEIVQKYLQKYPNRMLAYLHDARATHLEVYSGKILLKKLYYYGVYSKTFSNHSNFRVANMQEKLLTLSRCIAENNYSILQQIGLISALIIHYLAFAFGCFRVKRIKV
jgi:glycosyltransferase involved in cell wall biosynthesis